MTQASAAASAAAPAPAPAQAEQGPAAPRAQVRRLRWPGSPAHWPMRRKLLAMVLLPLLVVLPVLGIGLLVWGNAALDRLLETKVRSDLAVAHGYFDRVLAEVAGSAATIADSHALQAALTRSDGPRPAELRAVLDRAKRRERLDYLSLVAAGPQAADPNTDARPQVGVAVLDPADQAELGPALRARVPVPLLPTRNARPTTRSTETRAMVLHATATVRAPDGRPLAVLRTGLLLNRNLPFIDHINAIVYPEAALPFGSQGTATLFLDDVRISTNVRLFADGRAGTQEGESRAIGTRVSQAVSEAVLDRGQTWLGRAFVVNDWYVSAYEPLTDAQGRRVGMLYVGFLERPFVWIKYGVLVGIGAVFFAVMMAAAYGSARWARRIVEPIERMERTVQAVESGQRQARVGPVASGDEIGTLSRHLDGLLDTIDQHTTQLERWNAELDAKVAERTAALATTQQQLLRAEKMAAIGQLTAGIAHEVNNPIAVIQGNLDLLRELLGPDNSQRVGAELKLVDEQIERMRLIVTQLLQFARPTEYAGYVEAVDTGRVLKDCLVLAGHLLARTRIEVDFDLRATRTAGINRQELQQVLVNLLVNAIHAMADNGGRLDLSTRDWQDEQGRPGVCIEVADTGPGLDDTLLAELFQPFVTRKKDGTGLGLWISHSIVERYGGDIRAANRPAGSDGGPARGAVMQVLLLSDPASQPDQASTIAAPSTVPSGPHAAA